MGTEPGNDRGAIEFGIIRKHRSIRRHRWESEATRWSVLVGLSVAFGLAQPNSHVPVSDACVELNDAVLVQAANGQIERVESAVSRALAAGATHVDPSCTAVVLSNVAAAAASLGRLVEAERWAGRSISILEKSYPPNHPAFFHPLKRRGCPLHGFRPTRRETSRNARSAWSATDSPGHRYETASE